MMHSSTWMLAGVASLGLVLGPAAWPAQAGQARGHNIETIDCEGLGTIQVSTQDTHSDTNWGAVQIVDTSGHLMPVSFTFTLEDLTTDTVLFSDSQDKGSGNANNQQSTVTCSESFTGTLADFSEPGEPLPPGTSGDDLVLFTLTAEAIVKQ
jgi:hypothetical protein